MPEHIILEVRERVALVRINRPQRMNALNDAVAREICEALLAFDDDPAIGCMIVTGNDKAFAAGADIGAMADWTYAKVYGDDYITRDWEAIRRVRKPVIAAVAGYALGGGCELAMACDLIIAADTRQVRPARDHDRHDAGLRRNAAPAARRRQVARRWNGA